MPEATPQGDELYREEMAVTPIKYLVVFEVLIGTFFIILAFVSLSGALGSNAPSMVFLLLMAVVFFSSGWFVYNFSVYRITLTKDGWAKAYTLFRKPKIDLKLKTGRYRYIIFSTDNPDQMMNILGKKLNNAPGHVRSAF